MFIMKNPTVIVKCRTVLKTLFLYIHLCPSVKLNSLSCSCPSISFLTNGGTVFEPYPRCDKCKEEKSLNSFYQETKILQHSVWQSDLVYIKAQKYSNLGSRTSDIGPRISNLESRMILHGTH